MPNFQDILNTQLEEIKPPKPLPPGEYLGLIMDEPQITQRGKNQNHCVVFPIKLIQAISQDAAFQQELTNALEGKAIGDVKLSHMLWLTPDSAFRLKVFLVDHLGIEGAATPAQAISMARGRNLIISLGHYVNQREGEAPTIGMDI